MLGFHIENFAKEKKIRKCETLPQTLSLFKENPKILLRPIVKYSTEE
jgi:hypothetical protein